MIINDFVTAMEAKDFKALAECFTENCRLVDYCPAQVKQENSYVYGRNAVEMVFHNKFVFGLFTMRDPQIVNERTVNFYADYAGAIIHAVAQIENCNDGSCSTTDSLIKDMVIRPV